MSIRKGNDIIASKPLVDAVPTQDSTNAVSSGGVYTALQGKQATLISGTNIKTINSSSLLGSGDITIDGLPSQTGHSGEYLTTNGSSASWAAVNTLPSQTGQAGKFLTTDGTDASWSDTINPFNVKMQNLYYSAGIVFKGVGNNRDIFQLNMIPYTGLVEVDIRNNNNTRTGYYGIDSAVYPMLTGYTLGKSTNKWANLYTEKINNGSDITVPNTAGTMIVADYTGATAGRVLTLDSNLDAQWTDVSSGYHPDLFDFKWADHELNDVQWLRADTFSWQSGSVYQAAFNDLFNDIYISTSWRATGYANVYTASPTPEAGDTVYSDSACTTSVGTVTSYDSVNNQMSYNSVTWDYNSNSYVTPVSETVAGYSVDVYTGHSGKKIVSWQDESDVASIYTATGVAWYYIIDIANKRFKLPRTQYGVTGLRDTVGNYVAPGLPNITGTVTGLGDVTVSGAFERGARVAGNGGGAGNICADTFDASRSSAIYGNSTTVQAPATQMYLYFYVGEFTQTALENTAGLNAGLFNDKADIDLSNVNSTGKANVVEFITPDYASLITGSASSSTWTQCAKTSFVCVYGTDPWTENYYVYVSPDNGTTTYIVGHRYDDVNSNTQETSFTFIVPAGWYFNCGAENGNTYYIYPLKGVA